MKDPFIQDGSTRMWRILSCVKDPRICEGYPAFAEILSQTALLDRDSLTVEFEIELDQIFAHDASFLTGVEPYQLSLIAQLGTVIAI